MRQLPSPSASKLQGFTGRASDVANGSQNKENSPESKKSLMKNIFTPVKKGLFSAPNSSSPKPAKSGDDSYEDDPNFLSSIEHKRASVKKPVESRISKFSKMRGEERDSVQKPP